MRNSTETENVKNNQPKKTKQTNKKKKQPELKNTVTEMKNTGEDINSILADAEGISNPEERIMESTH